MHPAVIIIIKRTAFQIAMQAAELFAETAVEAVKKSGQFSVAVSGGDTPRLFFHLLTKNPFHSRIPWEKTDIFWVDERCVPVNHPASNFGTARVGFLDLLPLPKQRIHPMPGELMPEQGAQVYEKELICFFELKNGNLPAFDLIFLGMGKDGHTASIFPGQPSLDEKNKLVLPVMGGEPNVDRLTLTLPVLNNAGKVVFIVTALSKERTIRKVLAGDPCDLPAVKVNPVHGELIWMITGDPALLGDA